MDPQFRIIRVNDYLNSTKRDRKIVEILFFFSDRGLFFSCKESDV